MEEVNLNWLGREPLTVEEAIRTARFFLENVPTPTKEELAKALPEATFKDAPAVYLNSTENMKLLGSIVDPGCSGITVLGGGPFLIEFAFHGTRKILAFDINPHQYFPAALHLKAFQNWGYSRYYGFLDDSSQLFLSRRELSMLKRVAERNEPLFAFWDDILEKLVEESKLGKKLMAQSLNTSPEELDAITRKESKCARFTYSSFYRAKAQKPTLVDHIRGTELPKQAGTYIENAQAYEKAQRNLRRSNLTYVTANVDSLRTRLTELGVKEKVHFIYLSNIPEFYEAEKICQIVEDQLMPLLEDDGVILYCCQGTSEATLKSEERNMSVQQALTSLLNVIQNPLAPYYRNNSITAYKMLADRYGVITESVPSQILNGLDREDTFVYVKKR